MLFPSDLLRLAERGILPAGPVAVDTETSGLFPDMGARVSTVSVAFEADDRSRWLNAMFPTPEPALFHTESGRYQEATPSGIQTWAEEEIDQWTDAIVASFAWPFDQGVVGTGKPEDRGTQTLWPDTENLPREEWDCLLTWLALVGSDAGLGLTMHHAKFDCQMFRVGTRLFPGTAAYPLTVPDFSELVTWDTQNVADLLTGRQIPQRGSDGQPKPTTSLKPTAEFYWPGEGTTDEQKVVKAYLAKNKLPTGRWDLMPWDVIAKYADGDARLTCRLRIRQELDLSVASAPKWLDGQEGRMTAAEAVARRLATSKMLYRVERRGLPFDFSAALSAVGEIQQKITALQAALPFAPATLPMAKHYWFGEGTRNGVQGQGRTPLATTPSGAPQMDAEVVRKMVAQGFTGAETWRDIQKLQTADSKWYTGWSERAGEDRRLRTSVRQNGTVSGRFSVEGIQLQAIPHDYKLSNFEVLRGIPSPRTLIGRGVPEGYRMWELDLANAELRVAALMAQCKRHLELIDAGADLHADAAQELFNVGPDSPRFGEMRQVSKRFNFSAIFGIGWEKLQYDVEQQTGQRFSEAETRLLLRRWNSTYPEYERAIDATSQVLQARARKPGSRGFSYITLANGERRWFLPGEDYHKGFNQRVQPSLAQFSLDWWLESEQHLLELFGDAPRRLRYADGFECEGRIGMVLMVHDSQVLLVPDDASGTEAVQWAVDRGVQLWRERFPGVPGGVDASEWANHS